MSEVGENVTICLKHMILIIEKLSVDFKSSERSYGVGGRIRIRFYHLPVYLVPAVALLNALQYHNSNLKYIQLYSMYGSECYNCFVGDKNSKSNTSTRTIR